MKKVLASILAALLCFTCAGFELNECKAGGV